MGVWGYFSDQNDSSVDTFLSICDSILPKKIKDMLNNDFNNYRSYKYKYILLHLDKLFKKLEVQIKKLYKSGYYGIAIGTAILCIKYVQKIKYTDPLGYLPTSKLSKNELINIKLPRQINDNMKMLLLNSIEKEIEYTLANPDIFIKSPVAYKKRIRFLEKERDFFKKRRSTIKVKK